MLTTDGQAPNFTDTFPLTVSLWSPCLYSSCYCFAHNLSTKQLVNYLAQCQRVRPDSWLFVDYWEALERRGLGASEKRDTASEEQRGEEKSQLSFKVKCILALLQCEEQVLFVIEVINKPLATIRNPTLNHWSVQQNQTLKAGLQIIRTSRGFLYKQVYSFLLCAAQHLLHREDAHISVFVCACVLYLWEWTNFKRTYKVCCWGMYSQTCVWFSTLCRSQFSQELACLIDFTVLSNADPLLLLFSPFALDSLLLYSTKQWVMMTDIISGWAAAD